MTGTIVSIQRDKGFFFIRPDDGTSDYFAHRSEVRNVDWTTLRENDPVTFTATRHENGPRALDIYLNDPGRDGRSEFDRLFNL